MLKKYLGLSDVEIMENEKMWFEEQGESSNSNDFSSSELRNIGISSGDIGGDLDNLDDLESTENDNDEVDLDIDTDSGDDLPGTV